MQVLTLGNNGVLVKYLQRKLVALNFDVPVDGTFSNVTLNAVKDFQTRNGLVVDGKVGGQTWTKIYINTEYPREATAKIDRHNDIMVLHPAVRTAVVNVYVQLQSEGIPFRIFEAFRFPERQADLYAQGRTKPGGIVTYAKPWSSYHQYGLAVDFVLFINGDWSWDTSSSKIAFWNRLHALGAEQGLMRLDFEVPHLQLAGTSSDALKHGVYPPNGDKAWYDNMMFALNQ